MHNNAIVEHENGEHSKCMASYLIKHKETKNIHSLLLEQHHPEQEYWQKALICVASVIRFRASRGLPYC